MAEQNMNIYQRLAKIRKQVEVIQRNKSGYGYKYVSEDEILAKISGFMDKYHLSLIPSVVHTNTVVAPYHTMKTKVLQNKATGETKTYEENVNEILVNADMVFTWVNNDNPVERIDVPWILVGHQTDGSQSFGSGLSYAMRYFLLKFFNIATPDDDPDKWRSKQKAASAAEDKMIAEEIVNTFDSAVKEYLASHGILEALKSNESTAQFADELSIDLLNDFFDNSENLARHTLEGYKLCVDNVMNAAFRRDTFQSLKKCEAMCFNESIQNVEQEIYKALDDVMMEFSATTEVPAYSEVIDDCWEEIKGRQDSGAAGVPFKFPALNEYATIERSELFIFGAEQKQGKSMMLLNCAVDLLKQDYAVLYLDSELNTRLFTARILAHLYIVDNYLMPKCKYMGFCKERYTCGMMPRREVTTHG